MEFASFEKAEWMMEDWAAFAGMSVRTLSRQVQAEAALTAGYQNTSAFISAFRQVFGMTPGEYRRTLQGA